MLTDNYDALMVCTRGGHNGVSKAVGEYWEREKPICVGNETMSASWVDVIERVLLVKCASIEVTPCDASPQTN